jgi:uncharacterized protein (TIGR02302 family)
LRLDYAASDDYGIAKVQVTITRRDEAGEAVPLPGMPSKIVIDLPAASTDPRVARGVTFRDLTAHPWAGTPVRLMLVATDAIGQTGNAQPVDILLPERPFNNPVAKAIIEQRRLLTLQPENRVAVARRLFAIGNDAPAYQGDVVVTLALRIAGRRLIADKTGADIPEVQALLWQTAMRLEEGSISAAEMALRAAEQALQEALDRGASDEEIEKLMNDLQQAMNQFLDALTQQAMKNSPNGQIPPDAARQMTLQREDLQRLLDKAREMARGGARDAARQMLSQLQDMLENLRANPQAQTTDPAERQAQEVMRDLNDLARRQQNLLDKTYRDSQQLIWRAASRTFWTRPTAIPSSWPRANNRPTARAGPRNRASCRASCSSSTSGSTICSAACRSSSTRPAAKWAVPRIPCARASRVVRSSPRPGRCRICSRARPI